MLIQPVCNSIAERKMYLKYCLVLQSFLNKDKGVKVFSLDDYHVMD